MRKPGVSETRKRILKFIKEFVEEREYAPTVRDIVKGCGISSTAVVQHHLNILEREGHIRRDPKVFRSIQLVGKKNIVLVPLLGTISAGEPIPVLSPETWRNEALETLELTEELTKGKDVYALQVKGFSMIDALIGDGDIVLIHPANAVDDGDMAVIWLRREQEVTLKRVYRVYSEPGKIRLQPANMFMKPTFHKPNNVEIQGKVVGIMRKL